jgi:hypothetical protein
LLHDFPDDVVSFYSAICRYSIGDQFESASFSPF